MLQGRRQHERDMHTNTATVVGASTAHDITIPPEDVVSMVVLWCCGAGAGESHGAMELS